MRGYRGSLDRNRRGSLRVVRRLKVTAGANLASTDLNPANLTDDNLLGTNLSDANLSGTRFCHKAIPDGHF